MCLTRSREDGWTFKNKVVMMKWHAKTQHLDDCNICQEYSFVLSAIWRLVCSVFWRHRWKISFILKCCFRLFTFWGDFFQYGDVRDHTVPKYNRVTSMYMFHLSLSRGSDIIERGFKLLLALERKTVSMLWWCNWYLSNHVLPILYFGTCRYC